MPASSPGVPPFLKKALAVLPALVYDEFSTLTL